MVTEIKVGREGEDVVFTGPEGGKLAKIPAERAIELAHEILDQAEKALRNSGQLSEYE